MKQLEDFLYAVLNVFVMILFAIALNYELKDQLGHSIKILFTIACLSFYIISTILSIFILFKNYKN